MPKKSSFFGGLANQSFQSLSLSLSLVWTIMLYVCHTTSTQNDPVYRLLSGWATTTGRLLGPKLAFLRISDALQHRESNQGLRPFDY